MRSTFEVHPRFRLSLVDVVVVVFTYEFLFAHHTFLTEDFGLEFPLSTRSVCLKVYLLEHG